MTSPKAVDEQDEQISMKFSGHDAVPCGCLKITQNSDDTFTLEIDQAEITEIDVGTFVIGVELTDSTSAETRLKTLSSFDVTIGFEAFVPSEPEKGEGGDEKTEVLKEETEEETQF